MNKKGAILLLSCGLFLSFTTERSFATEGNKTNNVGAETALVAASKTTVSKDNPTVFEFPLNGEDNRMHRADGWSNGNMFNTTWRASQVNFEDGKMQLSINKDEENDKIPYISGEYRSNDNLHYGLYEVNMKPIKNDGVVSSFFTYTGPSENNPWDEIDIEFLGKDTTGVQFNYFTNGVGNKEYHHSLGFDASEAFHTYAFEWLPDSITWFVDGVKIYTATENIPQTPGKIMMNVWPGTGVDSWLNKFDGTVPLKAEYDWIKFTQYKIVDENGTTKPEEPTTKPEEPTTKPTDSSTTGSSTTNSSENVTPPSSTETTDTTSSSTSQSSEEESKTADKTTTPKNNSATSKKDLPATGENTHASYWTALGGMLILAGLGGALFFKNKNRKA